MCFVCARKVWKRSAFLSIIVLFAQDDKDPCSILESSAKTLADIQVG